MNAAWWKALELPKHLRGLAVIDQRGRDFECTKHGRPLSQCAECAPEAERCLDVTQEAKARR